MNFVLLGLFAVIGFVLGVSARARTEGDGSSAILSMLSVLVAFVVLIVLLVMISVGAKGDTTTAWRSVVALIAFLLSYIFRG